MITVDDPSSCTYAVKPEPHFDRSSPERVGSIAYLKESKKKKTHLDDEEHRQTTSVKKKNKKIYM